MSIQAKATAHPLSVGAIIVAIRLLTLLSKLALALAMARYLSPEDLGSYGLAVSVVSLAVLLTGLELYSQANREMVGSSSEQQAAITRNQFAFYSVTYVIATLVALLAALAGVITPAMAATVLALVIADHLSQELFRILVFLSRAILANIVLFVRAGLWVYALVAMMALWPDAIDVSTILYAWICGGILSIVIVFAFSDLPLRLALSRSTDWPWIWSRLRAAIPFLVTAFAATSSLYVDRLFLDAYVGREAVGVYTLFSSFSLAIPALVSASVSQQFLPLIVRSLADDPSASPPMIRRFFIANFAVGIGLAASASIAIGPLLHVVGHPEYAKGSEIFFVLVAAMVLRAFGDVPAAILYGVKADRRLAIANLASMLASICFNVLLVPKYDIMGAAVASLVASIVFLSLQYYFARQAYSQACSMRSP